MKRRYIIALWDYPTEKRSNCKTFRYWELPRVTALNSIRIYSMTTCFIIYPSFFFIENVNWVGIVNRCQSVCDDHQSGSTLTSCSRTARESLRKQIVRRPATDSLSVTSAKVALPNSETFLVYDVYKLRREQLRFVDLLPIVDLGAMLYVCIRLPRRFFDILL